MIERYVVQALYLIGQHWPRMAPSCLTGILFGVPGMLLMWAIALNLTGNRSKR